MQNQHIKYHNSIGNEIPSVTTILKFVNNNLDGWANYMGLKGINSRQYAKERAEYGTYIHSICEKFFKNWLNNPPSDFSNLTEIETNRELIDKLTVLYNKFKSIGYEYYDSEVVLTGETFGGTIDLIFYNKDANDYIICDFKTSKNAYAKYFIQLAGYTSLVQMKLNGNVKAVCVILVEKEITDPNFLSLCSLKDNEHNQEIFNHLLSIYYNCTKEERKFYYGR